MPSAKANHVMWSRDSDYVYFDGSLAGAAHLSRMNIRTRKLEALVSPKIRRAWGIWGEWRGLAPDNSLLFLRDIGSQEV